MKTTKANIQREVLSRLNSPIGSKIIETDSSSALKAVQNINNIYGDRQKGLTPLFIQDNTIKFNEKFFNLI